jgi:hypothetical protein
LAVDKLCRRHWVLSRHFRFLFSHVLWPNHHTTTLRRPSDDRDHSERSQTCRSLLLPLCAAGAAIQGTLARCPPRYPSARRRAFGQQERRTGQHLEDGEAAVRRLCLARRSRGESPSAVPLVLDQQGDRQRGGRNRRGSIADRERCRATVVSVTTPYFRTAYELRSWAGAMPDADTELFSGWGPHGTAGH